MEIWDQVLKLCYRKTCISTKYNQKVKWRPLCHLHCRTLRSPVTVLCLSLHPSLDPSLVLRHVRYYSAIAPCTVVTSIVHASLHLSCVPHRTHHASIIMSIITPVALQVLLPNGTAACAGWYDMCNGWHADKPAIRGRSWKKTTILMQQGCRHTEEVIQRSNER